MAWVPLTTLLGDDGSLPHLAHRSLYLMNKTLFKAKSRERYTPGQQLNTASINYGLSIQPAMSHYEDVYHAIINASCDSGLGFHILKTTAMAMQSGYDGALAIVSLFSDHPAEHAVDLQAYLPVYTFGKTIRLGPLSHLAGAAARCEAPIELEGPFDNGLWEALYEMVRQAVAPQAPPRTDVFFACLDIETTERFKSEFPHYGPAIWTLDASGCHTQFEADMAWLNQIDATASASQAGQMIAAYWRQQLSANPMMEVLLQGEITIGNVLGTAHEEAIYDR